MLAAKIDLLLKKFEGYSQDKAQTQTLQAFYARMTCEVCGNTGHSGNDCPETHEEAMYLNKNNNEFRPQGGQGCNQPCPFYQGGNGTSNSFNPNQPTLRDLVYGQTKVNEKIQKKLAANDKSLETIHAKLDGFSTAIKNQLSFNKMLETQLAQLAVAAPAVDTWKILGQPESTLKSVNAVTMRWGKPSSRSSCTSYIEKLIWPRRGPWGELVALVREDPGTPMISCSIFDFHFEQALCNLGASVNIMPKVTFEKFSYHALSPTMMCMQLADSTIRFPEGVVENFLVQVRDTFVLTDFVVLDMEGDLGISLILGRPFLRDAKAKIDVGIWKISFLIMRKNMKFRFQNKKELFLIHEVTKEKDCMLNLTGKIGKFMSPQQSQHGKIGKYIA
jgi:hypothetical protein